MSIYRHKDFFKWLEKNTEEGGEYSYSQRYWGSSWDPEHWDPEGASFDSRFSCGYDDFKEKVHDETLSCLLEKFFESMPRTEISSFIEEVKLEAKKFFQLGWRKCVLAGRVSQEDESGLIELFQFLKIWDGVQGTIRLVSLDYRSTRRVEELPLEDVPDHFPGVESERYSPKDGWKYSMPSLLERRFSQYFWVQFENPKKIENPLVAFVNGVIMAIPANMIPSGAELDELEQKTQIYLGQIKEKKED